MTWTWFPPRRKLPELPAKQTGIRPHTIFCHPFPQSKASLFVFVFLSLACLPSCVLVIVHVCVWFTVAPGLGASEQFATQTLRVRASPTSVGFATQTLRVRVSPSWFFLVGLGPRERIRGVGRKATGCGMIVWKCHVMNVVYVHSLSDTQICIAPAAPASFPL